MKLDATAYFQYAKDDVKSVSNTQEPDVLQKNIYVSTQEIRPECKVLRNEFNFWKVHRIMNTSGLLKIK